MTATPNLGLLLPTVGADLDTWGGENNNIIIAFDAALASAITGLTLSTAGSSGTFGIAAGSASGMTITSAYTKTTGAWAVGSGNGALDSGTIANSTWYHVWLIQRPDTGVVDILTSLSATAPTLPTNYTRQRRIGAMLTDGSAQWRKFIQLGDAFYWADSSQTFCNSQNNPTVAGRYTYTAACPTGIKCEAFIRGFVSGGGNSEFVVTSPDDAATAANSPAGNVTGAISTTNESVYFDMKGVRTDTSAKIAFILSDSGVLFYFTTYGWSDPRGKF